MSAFAPAAADLGISEHHVAEALLLMTIAATKEALRTHDIMTVDRSLARLEYVVAQMNALGAADMDRAKANSEKILDKTPVSLRGIVNGLVPCDCADCDKCRAAVEAAVDVQQVAAKAKWAGGDAALGALFGVIIERGPRDAGG